MVHKQLANCNHLVIYRNINEYLQCKLGRLSVSRQSSAADEGFYTQAVTVSPTNRHRSAVSDAHQGLGPHATEATIPMMSVVEKAGSAVNGNVIKVDVINGNNTEVKPKIQVSHV